MTLDLLDLNICKLSLRLEWRKGLLYVQTVLIWTATIQDYLTIRIREKNMRSYIVKYVIKLNWELNISISFHLQNSRDIYYHWKRLHVIICQLVLWNSTPYLSYRLHLVCSLILQTHFNSKSSLEIAWELLLHPKCTIYGFSPLFFFSRELARKRWASA